MIREEIASFRVNRVISIIQSFANQLPKETTIEKDKTTVKVSIPIEYQMNRPSVTEVNDILSLFKNFSNTSVQLKENSIVIYI